ncbi:MAG: cupin domain-containing protein [Candidatus Zixiibacteriota bacterium]|nr:MAG: cupin domain-containing protein [candidate division Zixibacteria bacterium]
MPFYNLDNIEERELIPGFRVKMIHTENMTMAYWKIRAGSILPEHSHVHEQVTNIIKGELELSIDGVKRVLTPSHPAVIPPEILHEGKAITDCEVIDVFYPIRKDYK